MRCEEDRRRKSDDEAQEHLLGRAARHVAPFEISWPCAFVRRGPRRGLLEQLAASHPTKGHDLACMRASLWQPCRFTEYNAPLRASSRHGGCALYVECIGVCSPQVPCATSSAFKSSSEDIEDMCG